LRVLIVDDEPLARAALARILAARPDVERFDSVSDAIEAQERLSKDSYDVMLLDISMPELSGLELLGRLQHYERPLPSVVLVTAHAQHAVAAFEKHAGSTKKNASIPFALMRICPLKSRFGINSSVNKWDLVRATFTPKAASSYTHLTQFSCDHCVSQFHTCQKLEATFGNCC